MIVLKKSDKMRNVRIENFERVDEVILINENTIRWYKHMTKKVFGCKLTGEIKMVSSCER